MSSFNGMPFEITRHSSILLDHFETAIGIFQILHYGYFSFEIIIIHDKFQIDVVKIIPYMDIIFTSSLVSEAYGFGLQKANLYFSTAKYSKAT